MRKARPSASGRSDAPVRKSAELGYSRPSSYEDLRAVLSSGTPRLPKRLKQAAVFLWQHPAAVALGTVTNVAEKAGVPPSTLVRFAQTFGYSGFSDLQDAFKAHFVRGGLSVAPAGFSEEGEIGRLVGGFLAASAASLAAAPARLDLSALDVMATALASAQTIYLLGSKRAFAPASYLSIAFFNLGVRNFLIDNVGASAFEMLRGATRRDALLAISFTPYNSITPELAAAAAEGGVPILSITDSAFSPLAPISKAYVEVVEDSFSGFKSLAATLAVALALALRVAQLREQD